MFARFGEVKVKPGKLDEYVRVFRDEMVPPARRQPGFRGVTVLTDPQANRVVMISYWATEDDVKAVEASTGSIQTQFSKISALVEASPVVTVMSVSHQVTS